MVLSPEWAAFAEQDAYMGQPDTWGTAQNVLDVVRNALSSASPASTPAPTSYAPVQYTPAPAPAPTPSVIQSTKNQVETVWDLFAGNPVEYVQEQIKKAQQAVAPYQGSYTTTHGVSGQTPQQELNNLYQAMNWEAQYNPTGDIGFDIVPYLNEKFSQQGYDVDPTAGVMPNSPQALQNQIRAQYLAELNQSADAGTISPAEYSAQAANLAGRSSGVGGNPIGEIAGLVGQVYKGIRNAQLPITPPVTPSILGPRLNLSGENPTVAQMYDAYDLGPEAAQLTQQLLGDNAASRIIGSAADIALAPENVAGGALLKGAGLGANLLGRGALSPTAYAATLGGLGAGMQAGEELGLPWEAQLLLGLTAATRAPGAVDSLARLGGAAGNEAVARVASSQIANNLLPLSVATEPRAAAAMARQVGNVDPLWAARQSVAGTGAGRIAGAGDIDLSALSREELISARNNFRQTLRSSFAEQPDDVIEQMAAQLNQSVIRNVDGTINRPQTISSLVNKSLPLPRSGAPLKTGPNAAEAIAQAPPAQQIAVENAVSDLPPTVKDAVTPMTIPEEAPPPRVNISDNNGNLPPAVENLTPEQRDHLDHFTQMTMGVINNNSQIQHLFDRARIATSWFSGDMADSRLAEIIGREFELEGYLNRFPELTNADKADITREWQKQMVQRLFPDPDEQSRALRELATQRSINFSNRMAGVDELADTLKSTSMNLDITVIFQQLEAAMRRGSIPTITGILADAANRIASRLNLPEFLPIYMRRDIDRLSQNIADGLQPSLGTSADLKKGSSLYGRIPVLGDRIEGALDGLADVQFGRIMGTVRHRAMEGLLTQNYLLHKISRGKLGGDITDPLVRRHIAEMANMIGSTSRGPSTAKRRAWERRGLLSSRMTRAQINEALAPVKAFRSQEDVLNFMNLIGSYAVVLGGAKAFNDQFGSEHSQFSMNPLDWNFGRITLSEKGPDGKPYVIDVLPQFSFPRALLQSVMSLQEGDMQRLQEAWQRYGFGRMNLIPSALGRAAGYGYNSDGDFHAIGGDRMPLREAVEASIPFPLMARDVAENPSSPFNWAASIGGQNKWELSTWQQQNNIARSQFDKSFNDLTPRQQAEINRQMMDEDVTIEDADRVRPFFRAKEQAYRDLAPAAMQEQYPTLRSLEEAFIAKYRDRLPPGEVYRKQDAEALFDKYLNQIGVNTDAVRKYKEEVIKADPWIIDLIQEMYNNDETLFPPSKADLAAAEVVKRYYESIGGQ